MRSRKGLSRSIALAPRGLGLRRFHDVVCRTPPRQRDILRLVIGRWQSSTLCIAHRKGIPTASQASCFQKGRLGSVHNSSCLIVNRVTRGSGGIMKPLTILLTGISALLHAAPAVAASVGVTLIPNAWILENYRGNEVTVWTNGTTGNCSRLHLDSQWTADDRNRFWSTVMSGKVAQRNVFVFYDDTTCHLVSFGLPGA